MKETLARLYEHLEWADSAVIDNLGRNPGPPAKAMDAFSHVLAAEKLWLERIGGQVGAPVAVWPKLTIQDCKALAESNRRAFRRILDATTETDLERPVSYVTSKGDKFTNTLGDILLHMALHCSYHRGQVAAAVRAAGGEPVNTDYINFVRSIKGR
jgi:uncharacterized damage-inducible protein DinB